MSDQIIVIERPYYTTSETKSIYSMSTKKEKKSFFEEFLKEYKTTIKNITSIFHST